MKLREWWLNLHTDTIKVRPTFEAVHVREVSSAYDKAVQRLVTISTDYSQLRHTETVYADYSAEFFMALAEFEKATSGSEGRGDG